MAKFFSLLTGLAAKKYAPQPPEIDYKPPEVYRVEPAVDGRQDDSASLASEYCDPEDVVRGRDVLHSDCEYSIPCDELTGVYSSPASKDVGVGERAPTIAEGPTGVSGLYRGSPNRHLPDSLFAAATEVPSSVLRDVSYGYQQNQQQPQIGRPSVGGGDNEDYDCPWDKGDIESEVYRMVQERQSSRTSDSTEPDSCNLSGRTAGLGRSVSVSSTASWSSAHQFVSGPGVGGLASPSSALLGDEGTSTSAAAAGNCSEEAAYADSSPCASKSLLQQQQQQSFGNAEYFDEVLTLDDPSREIWANVPASTVSSGAAKADCRKPIAMPRGDRRGRPQPNSSQCYVNLMPVALSAPPARALPSPAVAPGIRPLPAEAEGDLSAGLYDDPWDMRKVEEALLARDLELRSPSAAFGATAARAPPQPFASRSGGSCVGDSTESGDEPSLSAAGIERGRRALSEAGADDPAANATAAASSGLQSSKSVLALAAAFDGGAKAVGPPRSLPLLRSSSSGNDDQSPSGRTCDPSPLVPPATVPLGDTSTSNSLKRPRPAAAKAAASGSECGSSSNSSVVSVTATLPLLHVAEKERLGSADRRFEPTSRAHAATASLNAAAPGVTKAGVGCIATKAGGGTSVTTRLPNETLSPKPPADIVTLRSPVMAPDRRAEASAATASPSPPSWRKAAGAVADQDEAGAARRWPATSPRLHSRPAIEAESIGEARAPHAAAAEPAASTALTAAHGSGPKLGQAAAISPAEKSTTAAVPSVAKKPGTLQPLMQQRWFHGDITRQKAEELLANEPEGSFLVRMSSTGNKEYSLSFRVPALGVIHLKITSTVDGAYILGQFSQPFNTIADLIDHYSSNLVPLRHAEHVKLGKAICRLQH